MGTPWYFVLPADHHLPSGGNRYNEQLISALRQAGKPVEAVNFERYRKALSVDQPGYWFIDSLFVRALADTSYPGTKNMSTVFLLHHLGSMEEEGTEKQAQYLAEEKRAFEHIDTFLVTSSFSRHYLLAQGVCQPILVVEPGIDVPLLAQKAYSVPLPALMVANVIERKGILPWLQALDRRVSGTDAFTLTIVGRTDLEPTYAEACQQLVRESPRLRATVRFTGALPFSQVGEHYLRAQVFVSAAHTETFGMALQEAKAYRIPLLTLAGGYAGQHVTALHDGYVFRTLPEMADFFVHLVRHPTQVSEWQEKALARTSDPKYDWNDAARLLLQQLN